VITLADIAPGDEDKIAALCAELDLFYGGAPEGTPAERAAAVRDVLLGVPPLAHALLAWDGPELAGMAAYSFLWPAAGLSASLYLKELYVAEAYRRAGVGRLLMAGLYDVAWRRGLSPSSGPPTRPTPARRRSTRRSAPSRCRPSSSTVSPGKVSREL
jgi:GNAT superfamily N-acetyltransferase